MRQHPAEADDGAQAPGGFCRAPLDAQARLDAEGQQHRAVAQRRGRAVGLEGRQAEEADLHAAFAHLGLLLQGAVQQGNQRRTWRQGGAEAAAGQQAQALAEQGLGSFIDGHQGAGGVDHHGRIGAEFEGRGLQGQDIDAQGLR